MEKKEFKKYCSNCGEELEQDDKFCDKCGKKVKNRENEKIEKDFVKTKKCPNCGANINSFQTNCTYCKTEFIDIKSNKTIKEFNDGLNEILSKPMPPFKENESLLKKVIGKDFKNEDAKEEYERKFKYEKRKEAANYITNYPIPNSKEALLEFMILAVGNKKNDNDYKNEIDIAWEMKIQQIIQKAKLSITDEKDLNSILSIYENKIQSEKKEKKKKRNDVLLTFLTILLILLFMLNPKRILIIALILLCLGLFIYFKITGKNELQIKNIKIKKDSQKIIYIISGIILFILLII